MNTYREGLTVESGTVGCFGRKAQGSGTWMQMGGSQEAAMTLRMGAAIWKQEGMKPGSSPNQ